MRRVQWAVAFAIVMVVAGSVMPCTTVFSARDGARVAANNLDCSNVYPRVWFVPGGQGRYGRFCFGTDTKQRIAEGGMNERGLYIAVNALDRDTGWAPDPELPDWEQWEGWFESGVPDGVLAMCATLGEAVEVFRGYNLLTLAHVKFLIADASGASAIVEWTDQGLTVVPRGEAGEQISTNFVTSAYAAGEEPCERYTAAAALLAAPGWAPSVDGMRSVLSATHLEFQTPTVLSTICDLRSGEIHVYYFHDFERVVVFDLTKELEAGPHGFTLGELFDPKPYVATVYEGLGKRAGG